MWLRRAIFGWLIPAAFLLPLWLLIGWISFGSSGWALFWVFLSMPIVFVGQLVLTLLVRARGTVRAARAVSWTDVAGFGVWHCLIIALGFFNPAWWAGVFILTVAVGIALFWITLSQLWREARGAVVLHTADGMGYIPAAESTQRTPAADPEVIVLTEKRGPERP
ncbi:MFS transporter permease [Microbacterium terricola]|uniref:MFS transporter permease n=1 Tax=Microbacterium terricola TaxID=344163 RepID=A0ABM8DZ66_9MICO|nr:MFS transporter permease [Microbacterium terricola]UYK41385.1 MFS transporter permease [Microbacterium terricola]BDV30831.1 hypothetical protein Microterr_14910 [Microbacterium terricola]